MASNAHVVDREAYDELMQKMTHTNANCETLRTDFITEKQASDEETSTQNNEISDGKIDTVSMKPIGALCSVYKELNGTPRQPGLCKEATATLTIAKHIFNNPEHSLQDLSHFSYVWVLFVFHKNKNSHSKAKVKPPRMDGKKTGVFSTRSPYRPNPIGLSLAKLDKVQGATLYLSGIDMVDGTPILDIKPYIPYCDSPEQQAIAQSSQLTSNDPDPGSDPEPEIPAATIAPWLQTSTVGNLTVRFTPSADRDLGKFSQEAENKSYRLKHYDSVQSVRSAIADILQSDPRSAYRRKKCHDRLYYFSVDVVHVTCWFDDEQCIAEVLCCKPQRTENQTD